MTSNSLPPDPFPRGSEGQDDPILGRGPKYPNRPARTTAQKTATAVSLIMLFIGGIGYVPGLFPNDPAVSQHLSAVYLLFGIVGLVAVRSHQWARRYLLAGAAIYFGLLLHGLMLDPSSTAGPSPNNLGHGFHFLLAMVLLIAAVRTRRRGGRPHDQRNGPDSPWW